MKDIRAITLDLDDTLWEIGPVIRRAEAELWQWLAKHYPRIRDRWTAIDLEALRSSVFNEYPDRRHDFRYLRKQVLQRVAIDSGYTADLVEPAFAVFDTARNKVELYPEVLPELKWLAERFILVALTNGNANLQLIGIAEWFDDIVTSAAVGAAKPERAIFDAAIERAGVPAQQTLHVGDHAESDIQGAQSAGMRTIWVNRRAAEWPAHLSAPDATVDNLTGVRLLLQSARATGREELQ